MGSKTWFVTGVSSGLGLAIATEALARGHKVIGTVRSREKAAKAVHTIESKGGKARMGIDVLVNNAGLAYLGALEDFSDEEIHAQMEVNVYGPLRLIRVALPSFRKRSSGTIVNISSSAGIDALASSSTYSASKFAVEGVSEALSREVAEHNIQVLLVEPGHFRTNFLGAYQAPKSQTKLKHYTAAKNAFDAFDAANGKQAGDPVKAAQQVVKAVDGPFDGLRLPLGPDCVTRYEAKLERMREDLEKNREGAMSTNVQE